MASRNTEAVNEKVGQQAPLGLDEIGKGRAIEKVVEGDINMEAFMNEPVSIIVSPSANPEDCDVILPNCNGVNQPIIRGKEITVKRKYVEVLANSRRTDYETRSHDANDPSAIQAVPTTTLYYPFVVTRDPNRYGREWLEQLLAQPA